LVIIASGERKDVTVIEICIHSVKQKRRTHNNNRHPIHLATKTKRIDKSSVYVMCFPQTEEDQLGSGFFTGTDSEARPKQAWITVKVTVCSFVAYVTITA